MTRYYRVLPFDSNAAETEPGGVFFCGRGGQGRLDNPGLYRVLYLARDAEAAVAETLGRLPVWVAEDLTRGAHPLALAQLELDPMARLFDLDNIAALASIGIERPSRVVTRDRPTTQHWARTIYERGGFAGATWWSSYSPDWTVAGLWDRTGLRLVEQPQALRLDDPIVREAARIIVRQIER